MLTEQDIEGLNKRDKKCWEKFYTDCKSIIIMVSKSVLNDEHLAEDMFHEIYMSLYNKEVEFKTNPNEFIRYVTNLAKWRSIDYIKKESKNPLIGVEDLSKVNCSPIFDKQLEEKESKVLLKKALDRLKNKTNITHYNIFYDLLVNNKPLEEVEKKFNMPRSNIYLIKHRLQEKLRGIVCYD